MAYELSTPIRAGSACLCLASTVIGTMANYRLDHCIASVANNTLTNPHANNSFPTSNLTKKHFTQCSPKEQKRDAIIMISSYAVAMITSLLAVFGTSMATINKSLQGTRIQTTYGSV